VAAGDAVHGCRGPRARMAGSGDRKGDQRGEPPRRWEAVYDARAAVRCAGRVRAAPRLVGCAPMELFVGCRFEDGQAISHLGPACYRPIMLGQLLSR
jgi:hypothetical protein